MFKVVNIAGYQFTKLADLKALREELLARCKAWGLRGTILLSTEGINLFVAGLQGPIDELQAFLRSVPGLSGFTPKFSESEQQPFTRMLVRIKKEIIAFGVPGIDPSERTSPKLPATELKRWLDEGRPITLLDTRNDYEVKLGTFNNALTLDLDHFRNFPAAVQTLPDSLKEQPIVMFCTGGIRCEKAGPFMEREGFQQIYQLDGGILKYFEEVGGDHYHGECFVFDQRVGVDPSLAETDNTQCFACLTPLTAAEQADPRYVPSKSCPYCFVTPDEQMARSIAEREEAIRQITTPLPGSQPYENYRPVNIPAAYDGATLLDALSGIFTHVPRDQWQQRLDSGVIVTTQHHAVPPTQAVRSGDRYLHRYPSASEPDVNVAITILYEDEAIVVLDKPAPLPLHPCGRFNRNTLQSILNEVYAPQKLRPAHRLDANTTGVVVFARTRHFAGKLQPQFTRGEVEKVYLARVQGHPSSEAFVCEEPISNVPGDLGSRDVDETGLAARTEFQVLEVFDNGTALVEARPITGRTNQIRVHLWSLGLPILGDQAYLPAQKLGVTQTHEVEDAPLCLHAHNVTFTHPLTGERTTFKAPPPSWATQDQPLASSSISS